MNWLGLSTVLLGLAGYSFSLRWARKPMGRKSAVLTTAATVLLAMPAIVYVLYYSKLLGEPIWLYRIRSLPGSELAAAPAAFLAGWVQQRTIPHLRMSLIGKRLLVPVLLGFGLALPYLKPLLRPLDLSLLRDEWKGDTCLQSTLSTCGTASAATIVRRLGGHLTERQLAREAHTSRSGTENWYLARALRRHGLHTSFVQATSSEVQLPAIAGVRLKNLGSSGHFIALLDRDGDKLVVADPMEGLSTNTLANMESDYEFTGFFLVVQTNNVGPGN
jgi:predicted double-glycine peptidase